MPHFLIQQKQIKEDIIELFECDDFYHITRVLRIKQGETLKFIDENQFLYNAKVCEITKKSLKCKILSKEKCQRFLEYNLCLIQSILANDAQNLAIANATQAGVREIYPVISDNCSASKNENKIEKWQKIAYENFKQCERADLVKIHNVSTLKEALNKFDKKNILIFAEKSHNTNLNNCLFDIDKSKKIAVIIGPEGGFSDDEFNFFIKENFKLITLGSLIYKAPNAIVAGVSNIISRLE